MISEASGLLASERSEERRRRIAIVTIAIVIIAFVIIAIVAAVDR